MLSSQIKPQYFLRISDLLTRFHGKISLLPRNYRETVVSPRNYLYLSGFCLSRYCEIWPLSVKYEDEKKKIEYPGLPLPCGPIYQDEEKHKTACDHRDKSCSRSTSDKKNKKTKRISKKMPL